MILQKITPKGQSVQNRPNALPSLNNSTTSAILQQTSIFLFKLLGYGPDGIQKHSVAAWLMRYGLNNRWLQKLSTRALGPMAQILSYLANKVCALENPCDCGRRAREEPDLPPILRSFFCSGLLMGLAAIAAYLFPIIGPRTRRPFTYMLGPWHRGVDHSVHYEYDDAHELINPLLKVYLHNKSNWTCHSTSFPHWHVCHFIPHYLQQQH